MSLDRVKNRVLSLLDEGNKRDMVRFFTRAFSSDYLRTEYFEFLVDGIAETAREILRENKFNFDSIMCTMCNDVIDDPVTLKCGHTFSKKCILSEVQNDVFACFKCSKKYTFFYLSQLKNNVTILSLVEKLCSRYLLRYKSNLINNENPLVCGKRSVLLMNDVTYLDKKDFECPLCMRILLEPITTNCGHTFCRVCLNRCFDHQPTCPLCKASLATLLAERVQNTTEFLELAIKNLLPTEYAERQAIYLEEMEELRNAGIDPEHKIPLFVCTVALPTVPCPLHVFEPRYRLMIRQCMESGSKQFGMCGIVDDEIAEYGTMLEIREVQYFPDGRSIVDAVGRKRFRILRKGERDGYQTGAVEFLEDQPQSDTPLECIEEKHDRTYKISKIWFMHLPADTQHQILQHFGPMPHVETNYISSPDGPSWLWWMLAILPVETKLKVLLVSLTSLPRRLEFLHRILLHFQSAIMS